MAQITNSFEGIAAGATLSNANTGTGGNAFDLFSIGRGSAVTATNSQFMHGSSSAAISTGSAGNPASFGWSTSFGTQTTHFGRIYVRLTALPGTSDAFVEFLNAGTFVAGIQLTNTGILSVQNAAFSAVHNFSTVHSLSTWYRWEWKLVNSASVGQIILSMYAGDSTTAIETYTSPASQNFGTQVTQYSFGWNNGHPSQPLTYVDDVGLSTTALLGPASVPVALTDKAAAAEALSVSIGVPGTPIPVADAAAATEAISYAVSLSQTPRDVAAAADGLQVTIGGAPAPTPSATSLKPANPVFIRSQMPVMHVQNLLTGQWIHRDVQGVQNPSITWALNTADAFTCSLAPPRKDLLDASGNFLLAAWRDAVYLEENDEIKFGGILTACAANGISMGLTAMGFSGYPNGMIYEGPDYNVTKIEALDVYRYIWTYLQSQPGGNLGVRVDATKSGFLLGNQTPPGTAAVLYGPGPFTAGHTFIWVSPTLAGSFSANDVIVVNGDQYTVKTVEQNSSGNPTGKLNLTGPLRITYYTGQPVIQLQALQPFQMYWYNSTDLGQELASIQQEAVFDVREIHTWANAAKTAVVHRITFGVPRIGSRLQNLRFAEGENIVQPAQMSDGGSYANAVVGLGAGSGSAMIRANAENASTGRIRRNLTYTDQTVNTEARASAKAFKVLASVQNPDTVTQIVVKNHPNAPFGSFIPGDDIPVMVASGGWRKTTIWSRITSMTQDPTTNLMTISLARSDSFTYMAETGQAGTL
jgi:hypothetical protein